MIVIIVPDYAVASAREMRLERNENTLICKEFGDGAQSGPIPKRPQRGRFRRSLRNRRAMPCGARRRRWPDGFECPDCRGRKHCVVRRERGDCSSVTPAASRRPSGRERFSPRASCRCASGSRRSIRSRIEGRHFQPRIGSPARRHPDGGVDDEAQARAGHARAGAAAPM